MSLTVLVILFVVLHTALLAYSAYILHGLRNFKLNDQTYMFVPQPHLDQPKETKNHAQH